MPPSVDKLVKDAWWQGYQWGLLTGGALVIGLFKVIEFIVWLRF